MKKLLAFWHRICPFCTVGRKRPDSWLGRQVRKHWERGCPSRKAYLELHGDRDGGTRPPES